MMPIGDLWEALWPQTRQWRPARIVNESGDRIELQFQDAPGSSDLERTISTTRQAMENRHQFRR
jgi:hypothetical protein